MQKMTLWLIFISVLTAASAFGGDILRMDAAAVVAISDKNSDNLIDREEYNQRMTEVFFFIDTDKDGNLTISELMAVDKVDPRRFEAADWDGDQSLSLYEYLYALNRDFEEIDRNKDGTLDIEELRLIVGK